MSQAYEDPLVCPAGFTASATAFAQEHGIVLWDKHHLFELGGETQENEDT